MRPLKVVITAPWATRAGGSEQLLWTVTRHLDRRRVEVIVVFFEAGSFQVELAELGTATHVIPAGRLRQPIRFVRAVRSLARVLRRERPDILVNWSAKTHLYGSVAARLVEGPAPTAWWQHVIPTRNWLDSVATLLPTRGVICSSHAAAVAQGRLRPRRRTTVVLPGIEEPPLATAATLERIRNAHGIPHQRFVLAAVGRMQPGKRQDVFIAVIDRLRQRGHDVHGLIVGGTAFGLSTDYEPMVRSLVERLGLADAITFTGQVSDSAAYIQLADALMSTSDSESFGIALVEALALGSPVVAHDSGGPAEIVEDGVSGLLVKTLDVTALADAVERLIVDPDLGARLARAGRRQFDERFRAEHVAARFEEAVRELIGPAGV